MSFLLWSDIIRMEASIMTNTALRAEAQSADMAHMVFKDRKHEKFYYGKLAQARLTRYLPSIWALPPARWSGKALPRKREMSTARLPPTISC